MFAVCLVLTGALALLSALLPAFLCTAMKQPQSRHRDFAYLASPYCARVLRGKQSPKAGYVKHAAVGYIKKKKGKAWVSANVTTLLCSKHFLNKTASIIYYVYSGGIF